jgi:putative toxin-antitoxin system antitoxin component (TIGR02293 family)
MFVEPFHIAAVLGGVATLGIDVRTELELADAVRAGFPFQILDGIGRVFSPGEIDELVPKSTRSRRRTGGRFTPEESDRMERAARAYASTLSVLKNATKAHEWLRRPNRAMGGRKPIELLRSDAGLRTVETILQRIEHGVFS